MELNLLELKDNSFKLEYKLRFPIKCLKINISNTWMNFNNFITSPLIIEGREYPRTKLEYVLLDTGNEAKYCILSGYYLEPFRRIIKDIKTEKQVIHNFRGSKIVTEVSIEEFEFKFLSTYFTSKIGFTYQTSLNAMNVINIGINSIKQFLSIIFPYDENYYFYCSNIKNIKDSFK
ncbi:MAG: hypothetical protein ACTSQP_11300 [Promethearchaeota archaeon]